ncbi:MAG TPA: hypothetical protein VLG28_13245 [Acidimicrobiia bacterium]|jgi:hypothetical protein|nr:hypothetical protein [Acidimicrobiia bacterium]
MRRHVTFIHGIANQPTPDRMITSWKRALADGGDGLDLDLYGVTTSMVYWADVMYPETADAMVQNESVVFEGVTAGELHGDLDESYLETADPAQQAFLDAMFETYHLDADESTPVPDVSDVEEGGAHELEAVPLPWFVKKPLMKIFLRDVHHYLFNTEHTPRPDETYLVQDEIRGRYIADFDALQADRHVIVAHSMGTVISYDVLKRVPESLNVDGLITLGSPLGLSEIQEKMEPEYTKDNGFPEKLSMWVNVADGLDPVCGADPVIANDYKKNGELVIQDIKVRNEGAFRHPVNKYLRQRQVQDALKTALGL